MAHNDNVQLYGVWPNPIVPTPKRLAQLDDYQAKAINGDAGGTWTPTSPIILGGAGLTLAGSGGTVSAIVGGVKTQSGGKLVLGNNDFPTFSASRTRTIVMPIVPAMQGFGSGVDSDADPTFGCLRTLCNLAGTKIVVPIPKRYLHNGATLSTVTLAFRIGQPHGAPPGVQPGMTVLRVSTSGVSAALNSTALLQMSAANADAYYFKGNAQTLAYTCNQNNVIDTTQYQYVFTWTEEAGAIPNNGPPLNLLHSWTLAYTAIADQRFE